jgi:hypothetical protein
MLRSRLAVPHFADPIHGSGWLDLFLISRVKIYLFTSKVVSVVLAVAAWK